jgi:two-component system chemotaxis sensor kinase CheA
MGTHPLLDRIAESLGRCSAGDASALVLAREQLEELRTELSGSETALARLVLPEEVLHDPALPDFVVETRQHLEDAEAAVLEMEAGPFDGKTIDRIFRTFHTVKGVASFLQMEAMARLAHHTESLLAGIREQRLARRPEHADLLLRACDLLRVLLAHLSGGEAPLCAAIDALVQRLEDAARGRPATERSTPDAPANAAARVPSSMASTMKVATERLDALVDMVGELVIAQQMLDQDHEIAGVRSQGVKMKLAQMARITRVLQESAMSLRMVTVKSTFQRMSRLARDAAHRSGKRVQFAVSGEETELDRTVVEEIGDPLVHLVRNAIDHGIEPGPERLRLGKPEHGRVELKAYHEGGSIVIEIADDGRGLMREKIVAKAVERRLLGETSSGAAIADSDVWQLIFLPGFSTADEVGALSGRGVGLDVVRRNVEALRGEIEVRSSPGNGTCFRLRLPLTLAIVSGTVVRVGSQCYVVPTLVVERCLRPLREQKSSILGRGETVDVRGKLLPLFRLGELLGEPTETGSAEDGIGIVVEANGGRACLLVDEFLSQQQIVIKSLGDALPAIPGVAGAALLADGRVALILDVAALLPHGETSEPVVQRRGPKA